MVSHPTGPDPIGLGTAMATIGGAAALIALLIGGPARPAADAARDVPAFTLEQITQVRTLGQFAVAPDGSRMVYGLAGHYFGFATVPRFGEENNLRLMTLPARAGEAGGDVRQLTSGPAQKTAPVFSPSGDRVAFECEGDLWIVDVADGRTRRVTTNGAVDRAASWSPDGHDLAMVSTRGSKADIWIVSADGEDRGVRRLTDDALIKDDPRWSPDGKTIAFTGKRSDEFYSQGVFTAPAAGGAATRLTPADRFDYSTARWSPDGRQLAFQSDRSSYMHVWTMAADGSGAREFDSGTHETTAPYWSVQPVWSHDGTRLLVSANDQGRYELLRLDARSGRVEAIGRAPGQFHEIGWTAGDEPVYAYENMWSPPDVFAGLPPATGPPAAEATASSTSRARQLTHSSHVAFAPARTVPIEHVSFPSLDGLTIHALRLLPPNGTAPARKRPALVLLHPNGYGAFFDHWSPFYQYLAQSGYVVLLVNQRGSAGYGRAFREAQIGAWGTKTFDDVKAAAAYVRTFPQVDPARVGVIGMSYGGYQALLAYTKTPDLFQAVVDIAGNSDRRDNRADKYRTLQIGATEEENPELYRRISPITSVQDATAPLLIIQGDVDRNVAPEQTYKLVMELDRLKKPYELQLYPGEPHGLNDPAHQLDSYQHIVHFLDDHLHP